MCRQRVWPGRKGVGQVGVGIREMWTGVGWRVRGWILAYVSKAEAPFVWRKIIRAVWLPVILVVSRSFASATIPPWIWARMAFSVMSGWSCDMMIDRKAFEVPGIGL